MMSWRAWVLMGSGCLPWAVNTTIEGNLMLPDGTLSAVEDTAMLFGSLHQLKQVLVRLLRGTTVDSIVIMYGKMPSKWCVAGPFASGRHPGTSLS